MVCTQMGMMLTGKVAPLKNSIGIYSSWVMIAPSCAELTTAATIMPIERKAITPMHTNRNIESTLAGTGV